MSIYDEALSFDQAWEVVNQQMLGPEKTTMAAKLTGYVDTARKSIDVLVYKSHADTIKRYASPYGHLEVSMSVTREWNILAGIVKKQGVFKGVGRHTFGLDGNVVVYVIDYNNITIMYGFV